MKKEVDRVDATPSKLLFSSIIADYNLNRSICELVDNAIDTRVRNKKRGPLHVSLTLDERQQSIVVADDAGGVRKQDLTMLVGPGHTSNKPTDETIGFFGVGSKRAVVALAEEVKIETRHGKEKTHRLEWDEPWLKAEGWGLPVYEVAEIPPGTTLVQLSKLRIHLTPELVGDLIEHLSACYAKLLIKGDLSIKVGKKDIIPLTFENWAYPPDFGPRRYISTIPTDDGKSVRLDATAGLTLESSPVEGEYGVYLYCNNRLIGRALKTFEVGFSKGNAGQPHPRVSIMRVIIGLTGEAQLMPWNSSKSDLNPNHRVFKAIQKWLAQVVKDFASLSRRWEGEWEEKVFKFPKGKIEEINIDDIPNVTKSYLPDLPVSRPRYPVLLKINNAKLAKDKPWTRGLYEGVGAVDIISNAHFEQKNRINLIMLDSTLEIALKEYLVNEQKAKYYSDKQIAEIFSQRHKVDAEVKSHVPLTPDIWNKSKFYHDLRSKLVHERATVAVSDDEIAEFRSMVEQVLTALFGLTF